MLFRMPPGTLVHHRMSRYQWELQNGTQEDPNPKDQFVDSDGTGTMEVWNNFDRMLVSYQS